MKLLFITNGINGTGGLERVLSIKASYLADHFDYEIHIFSLNESIVSPFYEFSKEIQFHSIAVKGNSLKYIYSYISGIKQKIKIIQPDVISVCDDGLKGFFLPLILGKNRPIIYERHVSKEIEMNSNFSFLKKKIIYFKWMLMGLLANNFDAFVVLTNGNTTEWKHLKNLKVIPNPTSFYPEESSSLNNKKVIAVGKQGYQKGYDRLLNSWGKVSEKNREWELNIYGKANSDSNLEALSKQLEIQNSVNFYSPEKNIKEKYLESSIYVMSSRFEGFGMVLIEAMACGLPCVSFDCPHGPADIIKDGEDGILVPNGDEQKLAEAIELLINDKKLRLRMGAKARHNVKKYLPKHIVQQWHDLFTQLIKHG